MSKGSRLRPTDDEKYAKNYERVFGSKPLKVWKLARKRVSKKNSKIPKKNT